MFESGGRKGELFELKQELNANTLKERKNALKRVVAAMSLGRDMSSLFPDVVKNTTGDLSMKKLVYLYIINYANANADLSILIVNTFIKDASDANPLIRALAIRTMALIPLDKITEYLCNPLHAALEDNDPYVRKTAAVCVAKLYDTNPSLAIEEGFISRLQNLLSDGNSMTVANAVAALSQIADVSQTPSLLLLNSKTVQRFLIALSECTEWGQVFILDAISCYIPNDGAEADLMIERIIPRLQHANPAVVLAAIRVMVALMPQLNTEAKRSFLVKKMSAPLITLLKAQPEIQYVALRNISLLIRSYPLLLSSDVRVLFVSYTDPLYVKREKLDLLVQIANDSNSAVLFAELVEYAGEVDVIFSQTAVDAISRIALRLPSRTGECVAILSELLNRKIPHLTERIAIAVMDICRAFPKEYIVMVSQLCESVEDVEDSDAKAALVWIIGEHAQELPSALEMLEIISTNIHEESIFVQQQMLTAVAKTLMLCGTAAQNVADCVIRYAIEDSDNVDIRDRAFMYSRLIALGPEAMRDVVLTEKPKVSAAQPQIPDALHNELISCLSSLATVYHRPAIMFEGLKEKAPLGIPEGESAAEEDLLGLDEIGQDSHNESGSSNPLSGSQATSSQQTESSFLDELLGVSATSSVKASSYSGPAIDSVSATSSRTLAETSNKDKKSVKTESMKLLLSKVNGKGLEVHGKLVRTTGGGLAIHVLLQNFGRAPMSGFAIQINKNMFGLKPSMLPSVPESLLSGSSAELEILLDCLGEIDVSKEFSLQIALKYVPGGVVYFAMDVLSELDVLLDRTNGNVPKPVFLSTWSSVPDSMEVRTKVDVCENVINSLNWTSKKLESHGIFTVAKKLNTNPRVMYLSAKLVGASPHVILGELTLPQKGSHVAIMASKTAITDDIGTIASMKFNEICGRLLIE